MRKKMKKIFLVAFFSFLVLWWADMYPVENTKQVEQIDQEIERLEEVKRGYEAKALRHENQAERLQFDGQTYLETRRHLELADENRQKAAEVQKEIDRLRAERAKLDR